jgi:hypothetical protein
MIARAVAGLLIVTQLAFIVQPALASLEGGHESACTMMAQHDGAIPHQSVPSFDAPRDCDACRMPGCFYGHVCSATGPALVPESDSGLAGFAHAAGGSEASGSESRLFRTLIPPPPKA